MTYYNLNTYIQDKITAYYPTGTTIQYTEGDIYQVNWNQNSYPAFHLFLNNAVQNSKSFTFNLTLYYIDILIQDRSNKLAIESDGIEILKAIIASIDTDMSLNNISDLVAPITYNVFGSSQGFTDECAGTSVDFGLMYKNDTLCD